LAGATVEIVVESQTVASTTSDADGHVVLSGSFAAPVTCRASKAGYVTESEFAHAQPPSSNGSVAFTLPLAPTVKIVTGDYTLTFVADSACTDLPDDVRTRTYAATITSVPSSANQSPDGTLYMVQVPGTRSWASSIGGFPISVAGNYVASADDTGSQIMGDISPGRSLELNAWGGSAVETPTVSTLSFVADVKYCETGKPCSSCAQNSQITLTHK
jgi:hypothetical protein